MEYDNNNRIANLTTVASPLTRSDILDAIEQFNAASGDIDSYTDSTDYDLIVEGKHYPPKPIFGLALSKLTGITVKSHHFTGGEKSPCFITFKRLGFDIVEKGKTKVIRKNETFKYENFIVGNSYSKAEALATAEVSPPVNSREIVGPNPFKNCVVLFVTLDKTQKDETQRYKDTFLLDGQMFQWESQNSNTPKSPRIKMILNKEPVVLFARIQEKIKGKTQRFVFVGHLECKKYSYPIDSKNHPVEVMFDVLDYQKHAPEPLQSLYFWQIDGEAPIKTTNTVLTKTSPPVPSQKRKSKGKSTGNNSNTTNWAERDEKNRNLGLAGEELVLAYERQWLIDNNLPDLAEQIEHVALSNSSAGYDIKSYDENRKEKYIEVKTTRSSKSTAFYISRNEVEISRDLDTQYWIYRVYDLNEKSGQASFYEINGPVENHFNLEAETFKASKK